MQKIFMPELSTEERLRVLQDNYESKHETYYKTLDQDEIDSRQHDLSKNCIEVFKLEKRLKEIKAEYKDLIDPLKDANTKLMTEIDTGQAESAGHLFFVPDYDEKVMITYDSNGEFVSSRRLKPEEMQQRPINFLRPAANDQ